MNIDIGNKYIHAEPIGDIKGKPAYAIVTNRDSDIACVNYYSSWKRYAMTTGTPAIFDVGCLESIIKFIKGLE